MDFYQKFIQEKAKKKRELLGKMFFPRDPVLFMDISEQKDPSEFADLISGVSSLKVTVVVAAKNKQHMPEDEKIRYIDPKEKDNWLHAADLVLVLDGDTKSIFRDGCVPIAELDGEETVDYNPIQEQGNGFYFKNPTKWEIFASIVRGLETYKFALDWENLVREIVKKK